MNSQKFCSTLFLLFFSFFISSCAELLEVVDALASLDTNSSTTSVSTTSSVASAYCSGTNSRSSEVNELQNRITSLQHSIITIIATVPYNLYVQTSGSRTGYMQRSINGAPYTNISSQSTSVELGTGIRMALNGNFVITYKENLADLGNFDTLYYRASDGGTVMVTLNN